MSTRHPVRPRRNGASRRSAVLVMACWLAAAGCAASSDRDSVGPASTSTSTPTDSTTTTTAPSTDVTAIAVAWGALMTGPSNEDEIDGIAAGADDSVYATGKFEQSVSIGGVDLESVGMADIPIARFDVDGAPLWVARYGGPGEDNFFDIDADDTGAVATGIITGTVDFGEISVTSAGATDCVVVSFDNDGGVRWAQVFGGAGPDGCNEVVVADDGSIVTSLDTAGGWESPAGPIATTESRETVLLRLDAAGEVEWARVVGGPGSQRGKSIAVGPDGAVAFGGDTRGALVIGDDRFDAPGEATDAWMSYWSADGSLAWSAVWGGPGNDIAKGLAIGAAGVYAVGTFGGTIEIGGVPLDAGAGDDLAVARFDLSGVLDWATSVGSKQQGLAGAEVATAPDGGVMFAASVVEGLEIRSTSGAIVPLDDDAGGSLFLTSFRPDGSVGFASTIEGAVAAGADEISRSGSRVYLDVVVRGSDNTIGGDRLTAVRKDGLVVAIDLLAS